MPHADFVHLRVHTAYSLSEGAIHIKDLAKLAAGQRMPAVAVTDTGNLFGALEFSEAMAEQGVQPIVGCTLALARHEPERRPALPAARRPPERLVLLAQDEAGYGNLMRLSSLSYLRPDSPEGPHVTHADLAGHAEGLICLLGGAEGPVGRLLLDGQREAAWALARKLAALFPGRLYVELQRHGMAEEQQAEPGLLEIAYGLDLPLVATNDVFFARSEMFEAHDALLCIDQGVTVDTAERRRVTPEHWFKDAAAMRLLFADLPEAADNTLTIARRCAVRSPKRKPILPRYADDEPDILRRLAREGLAQRLAKLELDEAAGGPYRERLEYELDVIVRMGFAGYFLIVADFIQWAKREAVPVGPGRGSGAGSVAAWALKITDLDPLRFNLLFERFLNPERVSMPDFDIDFCQDKRDRVIQYVREKYGEEQVAQIITFGKLQARAVLRDVGRVLAMPFGQVDRLCKLVPNNPAKPVTLQQAIDGEPRLQQAREDEQVARLFDIALKLEGLYRHASTHAAGVVIGDRPLDRLVPLYRDPRSDMLVTQFNMKWVESAGLVKFDFLGLKTLTVLDQAVELLARRNIAVDIERLPLDDKGAYELIGRGDTAGIFQLESSGMRDMLRRMRPDSIEDIIAIVALYRPGPMDNIPKFIAVKHGKEEPDYLHPELKHILEETYGVIVYQEQVMQIAQVLSGYSLGEADLLRRAMGKKIQAEMDAQRADFVKGAEARQVPSQQATYIFDLVAKFAGYGFNKSHAAAYAMVAYQTAWLKANHPVEFMAALMTLDMNNTDKLGVFRQELDRMRVRLLPPDINRSDVAFSVEGANGASAIRYALAAIRNVGREAMRGLVEERRRGGPFRDIWDFAGRLDPRQVNKRQLENLVKAGAFDSLNPNRARLLASLDLLLRHAQQAADDRESRQVSLFGAGGAARAEPAPLPNVAEPSSMERLSQEAEAIGFYLSGHPLDAYRSVLKREGVQTVAELRVRALRGEDAARLAGTVLSRREISGARGRLAFVQLSDSSGVYEVLVFSEQLAARRELLEAGRSLILNVKVRQDGETLKLSVADLEDIDALAARSGGGLMLFLADVASLPSIDRILKDRGRGRGAVGLTVPLPEVGCDVEMRLPGGFALTPQVRAALKAVPGVLDVHDL